MKYLEHLIKEKNFRLKALKQGLEIWLDASDQKSMDVTSQGVVTKWRSQIGDNYLRKFDHNVQYKQVESNPVLKINQFGK